VAWSWGAVRGVTCITAASPAGFVTASLTRATAGSAATAARSSATVTLGAAGFEVDGEDQGAGEPGAEAVDEQLVGGAAGRSLGCGAGVGHRHAHAEHWGGEQEQDGHAADQVGPGPLGDALGPPAPVVVGPRLGAGGQAGHLEPVDARPSEAEQGGQQGDGGQDHHGDDEGR
jgi:hypothetical protein